jgi:hypothetical protein
MAFRTWRRGDDSDILLQVKYGVRQGFARIGVFLALALHTQGQKGNYHGVAFAWNLHWDVFITFDINPRP